MCGIVGVKTSPDKLDPQRVVAMRDSFCYRGPDDQGIWVNNDHGVGFGHRRLSIIDPTPSGHQPMVDAESGAVIVFNGEIYNYIEIRKHLMEQGVVFSTQTDTEVILKAYNVYGVDCLKHFNGMFAFAIWDEAKQRLFVARDRLGIKPFYYSCDGGELVFASEIKALKQWKPFTDIDHRLIDQYMTFGYVPGENTVVRGVKRLLPGHYAIYEDGVLQTQKYWDLQFDNQQDQGFRYYHDKAGEILTDSINLRLRSDVPLGIFLSGGIDSSAVVGMLADKVSEPLKTFSVAFDFGKNYNETSYARLVSQKFATDHKEVIVSPAEYTEFIPEYVRLMDEPVTDFAAISLYFVSQLARDHVTVVLSGEGSDELFAGYDLYRRMLLFEQLRSLSTGGAALASKLVSGLSSNPKLQRYAKALSVPLEQRYSGISAYDPATKEQLYCSDYRDQLNDGGDGEVLEFLSQLFAATESNDPLSRMLYFDTKTWLVDDLLIKADRMSMATSLELRVPFLDYRLVEFAAAMPSKYKVGKKQGKLLLKRMMEGLLPHEIIYRKKMGFPAPLAIMLRAELGDRARELLLSNDAKVTSYFHQPTIERLLREHISENRDHHRVLWQLLVLEEWLRQNT